MLMPKAKQSLLLDIAEAGERLVVVGERGHILVSDDEGESWRQVPVPTRQMLTAVKFVDASRGWAVGHDGIVLATMDGGESWVVQRTATGGNQATAASQQQAESEYPSPLLDIYFSDPLNGVAVGAFNTLLATSNGGVSWQLQSDAVPNPDEFHLNAVTGDGQGRLWIAAEGGLLFRSADFGMSWEELDSPYPGSWFGISRAPRSGRLLVFGLRSNVFYSDDEGDNWLASQVASDKSLAGGGFINQDYVMLVGAVGTYLFSDDGGETFTQRVLAQRLNFSAVLSAADHAVIVGQGGAVIAPGVGGDL